MKKWLLSLALYASLCLLAACAAGGGTTPATIPEGPEQTGSAAPDASAGAADSIVCRIVDGAEDGDLLLAKQDGGANDIYRLSVGDIPVSYVGDFAKELQNGMLLEVAFSGVILETYPAQFADVSGLNVLSDGIDDLSSLYLGVFEDLWAVDQGLNNNLKELGVDLSATRLSEAEQSAVAWRFGELHGLEAMQGTYEELIEQGYIKGEPIEGSEFKFWQWEEGCLFTITEAESASGTVTFDALKWRTGLGAYIFSECTAEQSAEGLWGAYQIGSEAIS